MLRGFRRGLLGRMGGLDRWRFLNFENWICLNDFRTQMEYMKQEKKGSRNVRRIENSRTSLSRLLELEADKEERRIRIKNKLLWGKLTTKIKPKQSKFTLKKFNKSTKVMPYHPVNQGKMKSIFEMNRLKYKRDVRSWFIFLLYILIINNPE